MLGLDNINYYYDVRLKYGSLREGGIDQPGDNFAYGAMVQSTKYMNCRFVKMGIDDKEPLDKLFAEEKFDKVVNLAAQAGVRYSITNPYAYLQSNLVGFLNILKPAAITKSSTWYSPRPVPCTASTARCLTAKMTRSTIR